MNMTQMHEVIEKVSLATTQEDFRKLSTYTRLPLVFWGIAGTGKTHGIIETGLRNNLAVLNLRLSQVTPEDMAFPLIDEIPNGSYTRGAEDDKVLTRIVAEMFPRTLETKRREIVGDEIIETNEPQINIEAVQKYIPQYERLKANMESQGLTVNDVKGVIVFFDELNRVVDKELFQMLFQIFEEGKFNNYELPKNSAIFAACNPASSEYIVEDWFADDAFSNRCVHLMLEASAKDFLEFAPEAGFQKSVINLVKEQPEALFEKNVNNFELPQLTRSLRNLKFLDAYVANNYIDWSPEVRGELISRIIGPSYASVFDKIEKEVNISVPNVEEILFEYDDYEVPNHIQEYYLDSDNRDLKQDQEAGIELLSHLDTQKPKSSVRSRVLEICSDPSQFDLVTRIVDDVIEYFNENKDDEKFYRKIDKTRLKFLRFILDLPRGSMNSLLSKLYSDNQTAAMLILTYNKKNDLDESALNTAERQLENLVNSHINITVDVLTKLDEIIVEEHSI